MSILKKQLIEGLEVCDIDSSDLKRSIYDESTKELIIEFKKGTKYGYKPVSEMIYQKFLTSSSQGKFFVAAIKNNREIVCSKIS